MYKTLEEIGDDLPDHSPRFILLSYPLTLVCFFFPSFQIHNQMSRSPKSQSRADRVSCPLAIRSSLRPLCDALLHADDVQQRAANAICGRKGVDAEHERGDQDY